MAFMVALAQNKNMREEEVSFYTRLSVYPEMTKDGEEDERMHARMCECAADAASELYQAWQEVSKLLSGKVQEIAYRYFVYFES